MVATVGSGHSAAHLRARAIAEPPAPRPADPGPRRADARLCAALEAEEKDATYYRDIDKQNTDHVKAELEQVVSKLEQAITYRYKNSHLFFNNGDKAGTGEMYRLKEQLEKLHASWDESVDLYGM